MTERATELAANLAQLRARIAAACAAAGRDPDAVALLPVTKYFPASDVEILYELGCREFAESREQEAAPKIAAVGHSDIRWHFIGRLQRNKAKAVAKWAAEIHSVDSERLVRTLADPARAVPVDVLVQVGLDTDPGRGGIAPQELSALADAVAEAPGLVLRGLMAVPPRDVDPAVAFAQLAQLHADLRRAHPAATKLSAGMSGDLEQAVQFGSTCVRVGTALLGARPIISQQH